MFIIPNLLSSHISCFLSLSLYSSAHHRRLHSFPTRRSSDLRSDGRGDHDGPRPAGSLAHARRRAADHGRCVLGSSTPRDRKSTRLNSSHRCISYAVFCLKKKKKGKNEIARCR